MMDLLQELDEAHCHCPYGAAGKEAQQLVGMCVNLQSQMFVLNFVEVEERHVSPNTSVLPGWVSCAFDPGGLQLSWHIVRLDL